MKRLLVVLFSLVFSGGVAAGEGEAETILRIDAAWNELRLQADVNELDKLLVDDWLLIHSDGRVQDKSAYLQELATRSRTNQAIENRDVRLRRFGSTAVVTGSSIQSGISNGKPWSGSFRFTRVWVRLEHRWRMVSSHSARIAGSQ